LCDQEETRSRVTKNRIEAFSDGVFAIAITLLVLTIAQPSDYHNLGNELAKRWPSLAAYLVSFAVIGIMWLNHHTIFGHIETIDRNLVYLNMLLLATVVFLPYPTGVFGEALRRGLGTREAAVFYSATMAINAFAWAGLWLYASTRRRLLDPAFPEEQRSIATLLFTGGTVLYVATIAIAFASAYACLAFHGALALYYAFDPLSRRAVVDPRSDAHPRADQPG
jgi:uncharacterized membrane protein